jgi:hypothetical protein
LNAKNSRSALEGQHKQAKYATKDMWLMHLQVDQNFEKYEFRV